MFGKTFVSVFSKVIVNKVLLLLSEVARPLLCKLTRLPALWTHCTCQTQLAHWISALRSFPTLAARKLCVVELFHHFTLTGNWRAVTYYTTIFNNLGAFVVCRLPASQGRVGYSAKASSQ